MAPTKRMLWWGRFDPAYARNGVIRQHLAVLGWTIFDFHPRFCIGGDLEATLRRLPRPDAVWVPCFRQRDLAAARRWCDRQGVPLIFDPLISAYDKQVWERFKLQEESPAAKRLLAWEQKLFAQADLLLADTRCHADFFCDTLGVSRERVRVVYVGAEESCFYPAAERAPHVPIEVLFYGSFIPLHGVQTLVEAARIYQGVPVRWHLLGHGPEREACRQAAAEMPQLVFEDPIPYASLPSRIQRADILLGVFGTTRKASRVIPNKVFQSLAAGRPVITRMSEAYPEAVQESEACALIPAGDANALATMVAAWASQPARLAERGRQAHALYQQVFSSAVVADQLRTALASGVV